jgi:predicted methyltransferase
MDHPLMIPPRSTELAQIILRAHIRQGDVVIDATAGNGHDTEFLAECVGQAGTVHAFDIQESAIRRSRLRIEAAGTLSRVRFHHLGHERMAACVDTASVSAVMFNLGYLPGADHALTTLPATTLAALDAAELCLRPGGVLSVVCYPGHDAGNGESRQVGEWMTSRTARGWRVSRHEVVGSRRSAPILLLACKRRDAMGSPDGPHQAPP